MLTRLLSETLPLTTAELLIFAGWLPPDKVSSWSCLSLNTGVQTDKVLSISKNENSPNPGNVPVNNLSNIYGAYSESSFKLILNFNELLAFSYALASTCRAIAHIKATSSRAIATTTTCAGFLLARIFLNRVHKRSWAFQAI